MKSLDPNWWQKSVSFRAAGEHIQWHLNHVSTSSCSPSLYLPPPFSSFHSPPLFHRLLYFFLSSFSLLCSYTLLSSIMWKERWNVRPSLYLWTYSFSGTFIPSEQVLGMPEHEWWVWNDWNIISQHLSGSWCPTATKLSSSWLCLDSLVSIDNTARVCGCARWGGGGRGGGGWVCVIVCVWVCVCVTVCAVSAVDLHLMSPFNVWLPDWEGVKERSEERRVGSECVSRWSPYS